MQPFELFPNRPELFYRGGDSIALLRGEKFENAHTPEDWIGSVVNLFGTEVGPSRMESGELLREAMRADPQAYFGAAHVAEFGPNPGILVKYLDAGERLPVHVHPSGEFARAHGLGACGKNEVWIVIETTVPEPFAYVGFKEGLDATELEAIVDRQKPGELLGLLNKIPVSRGDVIFVPAGVPHAIGDGVFIVEVQEPTDLSIMMEHARYGITAHDGSLRLGMAAALPAVDRGALSQDELGRLHSTWDSQSDVSAKEILPAPAEEYFRVESLKVRPGHPVWMDTDFSIYIVLRGSAVLTSASGALALGPGKAYLVPYSTGTYDLTGDADVLRCRSAARSPYGSANVAVVTGHEHTQI